MRTEISVLGTHLHTMLSVFAHASGLPIHAAVATEYAKEIRRAKGRFVAVSDMLVMDPENVKKAALTEKMEAAGNYSTVVDDPISRAGWDLHADVHMITRNYMLFSFMSYFPIETSIYMRLDFENQGVVLLVSTEMERLEEDWVKLV